MSSDRLESCFNNSGSYVGIRRVDADTYWLIQDLDGTQEWQIKLLNNGSSYCLKLSQIFEGDTMVKSLFDWGSVWEYAFSDATYGWIGNGHGQDNMQSMVIQVDGITKTLNNGDEYIGQTVTVTRISWFETSVDAHDLGTCTTIFTLTPSGGLDIDITVEWIIAPVNGLLMLPTNNILNRGIIGDSPNNYALILDSNWQTSTISTNLSLCFEYGGNWAAMIQADNGNNRDTYISEIGADGNKIYTTEAGENMGGTTRHFNTNYAVKYFPSANGIFLRP